MRLTALSVLAVSATLSAQSPLSMPFTANNGNSAGGVVYVDVNVLDPNGITIYALDVHSGSVVNTAGTINVHAKPGTYVGATTNALLWTLVGSGAVVSAGTPNPSPVCLGTGVFLPNGLSALAINNVGVTQRYTNGTGTATPGSGTNQTGSTAELTLLAGAAANTLFAATAPNTPRVFNGNLYYTSGNVPGAACTGTNASVSTFGSGCYASYASFYSLLPDAAAANAALNGQSMTLTRSGALYQAAWGGGTFLAPSGGAVNVFATASDDAEIVVTPSVPFASPTGAVASLRVHSNGIVAWGAAASTFPGSNNFTPTAASFLGNVNAGVYSWHDYNEAEAGSGRIVREEVVVGPDTLLVVTWNGVENYANPEVLNPSTMQIQVNLTQGHITIVWQSLDGNATSTFGSAHLVGYTPAGNSLDPGSINLATALPLTPAATDAGGLTLSSARPVLGTGWNLRSTNFDPVSPIGFQFFATAAVNPGVDLGFVGAPGCNGYTTGDLGAFTFPVAAGQGTYTIGVPYVGSLVGATLHSQSVGFTNANALLLNTSNGLTGTVGN